jgi:hypothetical protein
MPVLEVRGKPGGRSFASSRDDKEIPMRSPKTRSKPTALDDGDAFIPDCRRGPLHLADEEADALAEEFLTSATSGEEITEDARNELLPEELGFDYVAAVTVDSDEKEPS